MVVQLKKRGSLTTGGRTFYRNTKVTLTNDEYQKLGPYKDLFSEVKETPGKADKADDTKKAKA